jgi:hypothetical protein
MQANCTVILRIVRRGLSCAGIGVLRMYRGVVGPWLPPVCRFEPTCSRYAEEAISRYGLAGGTLRAAGRVLRCHPYHPGGFDPVR